MISLPARIVFFFGILMSLIYCGFGIILLFTKLGLPDLAFPYRSGLGIILVTYGTFRFYRYWRNLYDKEVKEPGNE